MRYNPACVIFSRSPCATPQQPSAMCAFRAKATGLDVFLVSGRPERSPIIVLLDVVTSSLGKSRDGQSSQKHQLCIYFYSFLFVFSFFFPPEFLSISIHLFTKIYISQGRALTGQEGLFLGSPKAHGGTKIEILKCEKNIFSKKKKISFFIYLFL